MTSSWMYNNDELQSLLYMKLTRNSDADNNETQ